MSSETVEHTVRDLVFAALNSRVIALDRYTGEIRWVWKSPKAARFMSLLVDGDRLIAAANGYLYCLDPIYGQEVWANPLEGFGVGITALASARGQSDASAAAMERAQQQAAAAAAGAAAAGA